MKTPILLFAAAVIVLPACGQDIPATQVPSVVQNTVVTKYANATHLEWNKKTGFYRAEFDIDKTEYTVHVADDGKLLLSKTEIPENALPAAVSAVVKKDHAGYAIDDMEKIEKDGMVYYLLELEKKGEKDKQLLFKPDGTIMVNTIDIL